MMKSKWFILCVFGFTFFSSPGFLIGQQQGQFTQFMYSKLLLNPAYAGAKETMCFTGVYRNQWIGLEGAPKTQRLSMNSPIKGERIGLGLEIYHHSIGISQEWTLTGSYAYRIKMAKGDLSVGLSSAIRYLGVDYSDPRLRATQGITPDNSIPVGNQQKTVPNFGAGIYYQSPKFYLGLSSPRLLRTNLDFQDESDGLNEEVQHFYLMTGYRIELSRMFALHPQVLFKYVIDVPLDIDMNLSFIIADQFDLGLTYRLEESIDFLFAVKANQNWIIGFSYDFGLNELQEYHSGSLEGVLRYSIGKKVREVVNPRFF